MNVTGWGFSQFILICVFSVRTIETYTEEGVGTLGIWIRSFNKLEANSKTGKVRRKKTTNDWISGMLNKTHWNINKVYTTVSTT